MQAILRYEGPSSGTDGMAKPAANPERGAGASITGIQFRVQGAASSTMKHGESVDIEVEIHCETALPKARVVIALLHSEQGPLFHLSSYFDNQWLELKPGRSVVTLSLQAPPLQFGSYYVEATLRGPELGDIYGQGRSAGALLVTDPLPNYEGFGINGVLLPARKWSIRP